MSTLFALLRLLLFCFTIAKAANWNTNVRILATERLDPIINPNGVASHMHTIVGGSAFSAAYNQADAEKSACTSFPISVDKSNYWHPTPYWINNNGTSFTPLPLFERIYYVREKNSPNDYIRPFPKGLRMITGNPMSKAPNKQAFEYLCRVSETFNGPGDIWSDNWNFNRDCPRGILVVHNFPSCWDGINLYKSDQSHMAYPPWAAFYGSCPSSHPIRLPGIKFEALVMTYRWAPGEAVNGKLAWANGDTTGFGAHADFTNGWDTEILGRALNDTVCGTSEDITFQECPIFQPFIADKVCAPEKGVLSEGTHVDLVPIPRLPGCNPLWSSGPKPGCATPPPDPDVTRFKGTDGSLIAAQPLVDPLPTVPGWKDIGCIRDSNDMLLNQIRYIDPNLTQTTCLDSCLRSGYQYASVGKAWSKDWTCDCGTGVNPLSETYPGMCNLTCPANSKEGCGGDSAHTVFIGPDGTKVAGDFSASYGCYANPPVGKVGLEQMSSYNFSQWSSMTRELCGQACADRGLDWAAIRSGGICFCGAKENYKLGDGNYVNEALCTSKCANNVTQTCGYWGGLSVFNVTASGYSGTIMNKAPGYVQCYQDWSRTSLNGEQFWDANLTPQKCQFSCRDLGYSLASVFDGSMCLCGNNLNNGEVLPTSLCSTPCSDRSSNYTCGGGGSGELYETSVVAAQVAAFNAKRSPGWQGCFANPANNVTADFTVTESGLSTTRCISACNELGYPWAGIMNREQCRCSKTDPRKNTKVVAANNFCNIKCNGDASQQCGGWDYVDLYNNPSLPSANNNTTTVVPNLPGYQGCFNGTFAAPAYKFSSSSMTVDMCTKSCKELGQPLAAVTMTSCACGGAWTGGVRLTSISCGSNCIGNSNQKCGGWPNQASLYSSDAGADTLAPLPGYMGCWQETSPKSLTGYGIWLDSQSVESCRAICSAKGYALAGMTNTKQCNCGNAMNSSSVQVPSQNCQVPCPGDPSQMCGQWDTVALYASSGDALVVTLSKPVPASSSTSMSFASSSTNNAVTSPLSVSSSRPAASVSSSAASLSTSTVPSMSASSSAASSASNSRFSSTTASATTTTPSSAASCVSDITTLNGAKYTSGYMTQDTCAFWCKGKSFAFAGVSGNTCYCGNIRPSVAASTCVTQCSGNTAQTCGGTNSATIISTASTIGLTDPYTAPSSTGDSGCWTDSNTRLMGLQVFSNSRLTRAMCLTGCQQRGFKFAGVQYSSQCYCSNALDSTTNNYRVPDSECSSKCGGDDNKCGGSWRVNVLAVPGSSGSSSVSSSAPSISSSSSSLFGPSRTTAPILSSSLPLASSVTSATPSAVRSSSSTPLPSSLAVSLSSTFSSSPSTSPRSSVMSFTAPPSISSSIAVSSSASISSAPTATTSSASSSAAPVASPSAVSDYIGCYVDQASPRVFSNYTFTNGGMTTEMCRKACTVERKFTYYATSYGTQCFCGAAAPGTTTKRAVEADCKYACGGDKATMCGGYWRVSVYGPPGSVSLAGPPPSRRSGGRKRGSRLGFKRI